MTIGLVLLFALVAAYTKLDLLYSHKFFDVTGRAQWIWDNHRLASGDPLAFFAVHDFDLPEHRYFTHVKIAGDPEYTLWFNGREIGGHRVGERPPLDVYDVTRLARTGRNRIVVALRSPNGVGGLIASVDLAPDTQNFVVSGKDWQIFRRWSDDLPLRNPAAMQPLAPMLLGEPPARRWNYLTAQDVPLAEALKTSSGPRAVFTIDAALPEVRIIDGVAVAVTKKVRATVYDFGFTRGHALLTISPPRPSSTLIEVRFANVQSELAPAEGNVEPFVFAAGERTVHDSEERGFRYVMVYGSGASVVVER